MRSLVQGESKGVPSVADSVALEDEYAVLQRGRPSDRLNSRKVSITHREKNDRKEIEKSEKKKSGLVTAEEIFEGESLFRQRRESQKMRPATKVEKHTLELCLLCSLKTIWKRTWPKGMERGGGNLCRVAGESRVVVDESNPHVAAKHLRDVTTTATARDAVP